MIPKCVQNKKEHKELEDKITLAISNKVQYKRLSWGKSISLTMQISGYAIAMCGISSVYILWRNGSDFAYRRIFGEDSLTIKTSEDRNTITFSNTNDFSMTIFYSLGS